MGTTPFRFASSLPAFQILLINSKFHEGVSVWEALGISEERLGKAPTPVPVPSESNTGNPTEAVSAGKVGGEASGGKEIEDTRASARQRFAKFFESVLGLAMGDWPKVVDRCEKEGGPLKVNDQKNTKGKGKAKQDIQEDAMEEEGGEGGIEETPYQGGCDDVEGDEQRYAMAPGEGAGRGGKKREHRCPGWEGLSFHERIAYVMFMVNVFQVSSISIFFCLEINTVLIRARSLHSNRFCVTYSIEFGRFYIGVNTLSLLV